MNEPETVEDLVESLGLKKGHDRLVGVLREEVEFILDVMGIDAIYVSDETQLSDFMLSTKDLKSLGDALSIPCKHQDYLVDVALRLHHTRGGVSN